MQPVLVKKGQRVNKRHDLDFHPICDVILMAENLVIVFFLKLF